MRLATWNVNSLRSRIGRVEAFLERHDVDVLAVQETKAREEQLPAMGLQAMGYDVAAVGYDQWNGVAVISRVGLADVEIGFPGMPTWGDPVAADTDVALSRSSSGNSSIAMLRFTPMPGTTIGPDAVVCSSVRMPAVLRPAMSTSFGHLIRASGVQLSTASAAARPTTSPISGVSSGSIGGRKRIEI